MNNDVTAGNLSDTNAASGLGDLTRRGFLATSGTLTAAVVVAGAAASVAGFSSGLLLPRTARAASGLSAGRLKVGVIGCGGRGTGAAINMLEASDDVEIVAIGDMFPDRIAGARSELAKLEKPLLDRVKVTDATAFTGFDAYKNVLGSGVDVVILATPPGFRPMHFAAAVDAGKHVFMEKPVAVDPAGVRKVIAAAKLAGEKKLSVVAGTQRRHETCYLEAMKRVQDGAIGKVLSANVYWNQGSLWMNERQPNWSDMEWQLRNWLYFTWLSGDHICEQHVHNLDAAAWFMGDSPKSASGQGGRQVRISPAYGHGFDHFAVDFEYADGRRVSSYCRQIDGCSNRVEEIIFGSDGTLRLSSGRAEIIGKKAWKWKGEQLNPYVQEQRDLIASITGGTYLNDGERIAKNTMMAIMGRMSAYTGKDVSWEFAMNSQLDTMPTSLDLSSLETPPVAVPGKTPLV